MRIPGGQQQSGAVGRKRTQWEYKTCSLTWLFSGDWSIFKLQPPEKSPAVLLFIAVLITVGLALSSGHHSCYSVLISLQPPTPCLTVAAFPPKASVSSTPREPVFSPATGRATSVPRPSILAIHGQILSLASLISSKVTNPIPQISGFLFYNHQWRGLSYLETFHQLLFSVETQPSDKNLNLTWC